MKGKQIIKFLVGAMSITFLTSCGHTHNINHMDYKAPTCTEDGNQDYYYCTDCHLMFEDQDATKPLEDVIIPHLEHNITACEATLSTCSVSGHQAHYECTNCHECYSDAAGQNKINLADISTPISPNNHVMFTKVGDIYKCLGCKANLGTVYNVATALDAVTISVDATGKAKGYDKKKTSGEYTYVAFNDRYEMGFTVHVNAENACEADVYLNVSATNATNKVPLSSSVSLKVNNSPVAVSGHYVHNTDAERHADRWTDFIYNKIGHVSLVKGMNEVSFQNTKQYGFNICDIAFLNCASELTLPSACDVNGYHTYKTELEVIGAKTTYTAGEAFSLNGVTVNRVCELCSHKEAVNLADVVISNPNVLTAQDTTITLSYTVGEVTYTKVLNLTIEHAHTLVLQNAQEATCEHDQIIQHYECSECHKCFSDAQGTNLITEITVADTKLPHTLSAVTKENDCCNDYYTCSVCKGFFLDADGKYSTSEEFAKETVSHNHASLSNVDGEECVCDKCGKTVYDFRFDDQRFITSTTLDKKVFSLTGSYDTFVTAKTNLNVEKACKGKVSFDLCEVRYYELINNPNGITDFYLKINGAEQEIAPSLVKGTGASPFDNFSLTYFGEFDFKQGINSIELGFNIHKKVTEGTSKYGNAFTIRKMCIESDTKFSFEACPVCLLTHDSSAASHCEHSHTIEYHANKATLSEGSVGSAKGLKYINAEADVTRTATFTVNSDANKTVKLYISHAAENATEATALGNSFVVKVNDGADIISQQLKHLHSTSTSRGRKSGTPAYDFAYTLVGEITLNSGNNTIAIKLTGVNPVNLYKIAIVE